MPGALGRLDAIARSSGFGLIVLIVSNAIPLFGVLFLDWEVQTLLILYWIESGVVGVINVFKMARAEGPLLPTQHPSVFKVPSGAAKVFLIPFFILHYGIFWMVHGFFVFLLPVFAGAAAFLPGREAGAIPRSSLTAEGLAIAALALLASHLISFYFNFLRRGEYRNVSVAAQMAQPYGRVFVLHLTIILGGTLIFALGQPIALLAILVVGKTILDMVLYLRTHRSAQVPPPDALAVAPGPPGPAGPWSPGPPV